MTGRVSATLANTADGVTPTGPASSSRRDEGPQLCALGPRLCLTRVCGSPSLSRSRVGRPPIDPGAERQWEAADAEDVAF